MQFIEFSGKTLFKVVNPDEVDPDDLRAAGVTEESMVRVNRQGDIEVRKSSGWEIIGGLLGDFEKRVKAETGLDWS